MKPRRYKYGAGGPKLARYRPYWRSRMTNHHGTNTVYTEAQTLEEAVDIIIQKRKAKGRPYTMNKKKQVRTKDKELGYTKPKSVSLPKLRFLKHGDE